MKYRFPAKTFLLGEYAALWGGPAMVLTTTPAFEVSIASDASPDSFHPDSPAGRFVHEHHLSAHFDWFDPYHGIGGLGASSAQFLGAYFAYLDMHEKALVLDDLLQTYWAHSYNHNMYKPSGYDVLAQASSGCVYLHHQKADYKAYPWPFTDIDFILLHTKNKLATHEHLSELALNQDAMSQRLEPIVHAAQSAFQTRNSEALVSAINAYHAALLSFQLVSAHTVQHIQKLSAEKQILAAKGCGAMGADVLLLIVTNDALDSLVSSFNLAGHHVLATSKTIYQADKSDQVLFSP